MKHAPLVDKKRVCTYQRMNESVYFKSLDARAKKRYLEKLVCVGLSIEDDPYLPSNYGKFANDMTTWPTLEYGHIFCYFIK